ncbi:MAG: HlyD family efflux transporter periplasmic adaptor subunit [Bacteroidota bacterium]|nr:HlyD family efflux transporter periplasmic adaptor subunit [Bacteroidota bacterium]
MENYISTHIESRTEDAGWESFGKIYGIRKRNHVKKWLLGILIFLFLILLLPWTQNIRARGTVTTLRQEQRPQELNTVIPGKIVKWYIKEGDFVKAGDTLVQLGEVKVEYFDPELINRTREQIEAKQKSRQEYLNKSGAGEQQLAALKESLQLKLSSLDNKIGQQLLKITSDSMDILAINNELQVYQRQINAAKVMLDSGAISLTDFEKRKVNYQNALAKKTGTENKYQQGKQELLNLRIEKNSAEQEYRDKIAKTEGEQFSSLSAAAATTADVAKLQNALANYDARNQLYYIIAPQNGQIVRSKKAGIGEMVKEGEMLVEMVPSGVDRAVELYINPMDIPLVTVGQKVRFVFDGFPAIVFSGWPKNSYGTFGGKVVAIEKALGKNGKFRILVSEDPDDRKWPAQLPLGAGANGIALLKDVPIYYELWRNINGFPPDYYTDSDTKPNKK